jgi:hypothetical protein
MCFGHSKVHTLYQPFLRIRNLEECILRKGQLWWYSIEVPFIPTVKYVSLPPQGNTIFFDSFENHSTSKSTFYLSTEIGFLYTYAFMHPFEWITATKRRKRKKLQNSSERKNFFPLQSTSEIGDFIKENKADLEELHLRQKFDLTKILLYFTYFIER